jgi:hypothetical protein
MIFYSILFYHGYRFQRMHASCFIGVPTHVPVYKEKNRLSGMLSPHFFLFVGLRELGDFVMELKWDFSSWVPLVSRILPSDICKITKKVPVRNWYGRYSVADPDNFWPDPDPDLNKFVMELNWDFSSWVPLVSRILPSDICKITKKVVRLNGYDR